MAALGLAFLALMLFLFYASGKYKNPYKLYFYFGKKGCGKTTHICKMSLKYLRHGKNVYTTEYIPNTYHIDYRDIGSYHFPEGSVIFIDEVGMIWDNRKFKDFKDEVRDFFKLQRHYKLTVYLYSQCPDIDKKLRDLCDELYITKSYFNCISVNKKIRRDLKIVEASAEAESRITDDLKMMPFFFPGARQYTYMPRYHKYFNSFSAPKLPKKPYKLYCTDKSTDKHLKAQIWLARRQFSDTLNIYKNLLVYWVNYGRRNRKKL